MDSEFINISLHINDVLLANLFSQHLQLNSQHVVIFVVKKKEQS